MTATERLAAAARARGLDVAAVYDDFIEVTATLSTVVWAAPDDADPHTVHLTLAYPTWTYEHGNDVTEAEFGSLPTADALRWIAWVGKATTDAEARHEAELDAVAAATGW